MGKRKRRKQYLRPDGQPILCYLCNNRPAETDDHVPPQGLFPNNAQFKGFKVPACWQCNNSFSMDDEYLRDVLTMGCSNADALQVLQEKTLPSMSRPWAQLQRVRKEDRIVAKTFPVPMVSPSGLQLPTEMALQFDSERVNRVCARIVRGLYYHIAKAPLAKKCEIFSALLTPKQANETYERLKEQGDPRVGHVAGNTFLFAMWGVPQDRHMTAIWLLRFYDEITAMVIVKGPYSLTANHDLAE